MTLRRSFIQRSRSVSGDRKIVVNVGVDTCDAAEPMKAFQPNLTQIFAPAVGPQTDLCLWVPRSRSLKAFVKNA